MEETEIKNKIRDISVAENVERSENKNKLHGEKHNDQSAKKNNHKKRKSKKSSSSGYSDKVQKKNEKGTSKVLKNYVGEDECLAEVCSKDNKSISKQKSHKKIKKVVPESSQCIQSENDKTPTITDNTSDGVLAGKSGCPSRRSKSSSAEKSNSNLSKLTQHTQNTTSLKKENIPEKLIRALSEHPLKPTKSKFTSYLQNFMPKTAAESPETFIASKTFYSDLWFQKGHKPRKCQPSRNDSNKVNPKAADEEPKNNLRSSYINWLIEERKFFVEPEDEFPTFFVNAKFCLKPKKSEQNNANRTHHETKPKKTLKKKKSKRNIDKKNKKLDKKSERKNSQKMNKEKSGSKEKNEFDTPKTSKEKSPEKFPSGVRVFTSEENLRHIKSKEYIKRTLSLDELSNLKTMKSSDVIEFFLQPNHDDTRSIEMKVSDIINVKDIIKPIDEKLQGHQKESKTNKPIGNLFTTEHPFTAGTDFVRQTMGKSEVKRTESIESVSIAIKRNNIYNSCGSLNIEIFHNNENSCEQNTQNDCNKTYLDTNSKVYNSEFVGENNYNSNEYYRVRNEYIPTSFPVQKNKPQADSYENDYFNNLQLGINLVNQQQTYAPSRRYNNDTNDESVPQLNKFENQKFHDFYNQTQNYSSAVSFKQSSENTYTPRSTSNLNNHVEYDIDGNLNSTYIKTTLQAQTNSRKNFILQSKQDCLPVREVLSNSYNINNNNYNDLHENTVYFDDKFKNAYRPFEQNSLEEIVDKEVNKFDSTGNTPVTGDQLMSAKEKINMLKQISPHNRESFKSMFVNIKSSSPFIIKMNKEKPIKETKNNTKSLNTNGKIFPINKEYISFSILQNKEGLKNETIEKFKNTGVHSKVKEHNSLNMISSRKRKYDLVDECEDNDGNYVISNSEEDEEYNYNNTNCYAETKYDTDYDIAHMLPEMTGISDQSSLPLNSKENQNDLSLLCIMSDLRQKVNLLQSQISYMQTNCNKCENIESLLVKLKTDVSQGLKHVESKLKEIESDHKHFENYVIKDEINLMKTDNTNTLERSCSSLQNNCSRNDDTVQNNHNSEQKQIKLNSKQRVVQTDAAVMTDEDSSYKICTSCQLINLDQKIKDGSKLLKLSEKETQCKLNGEKGYEELRCTKTTQNTSKEECIIETKESAPQHRLKKSPDIPVESINEKHKKGRRTKNQLTSNRQPRVTNKNCTIL